MNFAAPSDSAFEIGPSPAGLCATFAGFWRTLMALVGLLVLPGRRAEGESRLEALETAIARDFMRTALAQLGHDPGLADHMNPRLIFRNGVCDVVFDDPPEQPEPRPRVNLAAYARSLREYRRIRALIFVLTRCGRRRRLRRHELVRLRRRVGSRRFRAFVRRARQPAVRAHEGLAPSRAPPACVSG